MLAKLTKQINNTIVIEGKANLKKINWPKVTRTHEIFSFEMALQI